jgi:hypothetical protein
MKLFYVFEIFFFTAAKRGKRMDFATTHFTHSGGASSNTTVLEAVVAVAYLPPAAVT